MRARECHCIIWCAKRCVAVSVPPCAAVSVPPCVAVSVPPCAAVRVPPCAAVSVPPFAAVSVPPCVAVSVPPCAAVSVPPCAAVSVPPCGDVTQQLCCRYSSVQDNNVNGGRRDVTVLRNASPLCRSVSGGLLTGSLFQLPVVPFVRTAETKNGGTDLHSGRISRSVILSRCQQLVETHEMLSGAACSRAVWS